MNTVAFKGLGFELNINPVALELGGLRIYWYGIIISLAFMTGFLVLMNYAKKNKFDQEILLDLILLATPIAVIGARLYYVIFKFDEYIYNPSEIFKVWHGGLAIYGAIISAFLTGLVYCRIKKLNFWIIADMAAPSFVIAQAIGRWGNFINQEAYGRETSLPWAMTIIENGIPKSVHPTFLYESLWNLLVFVTLVYFYKKYKKVDGEVFLAYVGLYSLGRIFIESLRTDSLYLGFFRVSQIVALFFIIFSVIMFATRRRKAFDSSNM